MGFDHDHITLDSVQKGAKKRSGVEAIAQDSSRCHHVAYYDPRGKVFRKVSGLQSSSGKHSDTRRKADVKRVKEAFRKIFRDTGSPEGIFLVYALRDGKKGKELVVLQAMRITKHKRSKEEKKKIQDKKQEALRTKRNMSQGLRRRLEAPVGDYSSPKKQQIPLMDLADGSFLSASAPIVSGSRNLSSRRTVSMSAPGASSSSPGPKLGRSLTEYFSSRRQDAKKPSPIPRKVSTAQTSWQGLSGPHQDASFDSSEISGSTSSGGEKTRLEGLSMDSSDEIPN